MQQPLLALLLALMLAAASAVHDESYCKITPYDPNVKLPDPPKSFYMVVTSQSASGQVTGMDYYDEEMKMSAYMLGNSNSSFRVLMNHATGQAQVIDMGSKSIPGNCGVQSIPNNDLLVGVEIFPGIRYGVPSKTMFFGSGGEGIKYLGNDTINGMRVEKYYSCYYLASFDVSLKLVWFFKDIHTFPTPVRVVLAKQFNSEAKRFEMETLEITGYRARSPSWTARTNPFVAPPGIYCPGLISNRALPKLPQRFSIRMEEIIDGVSEPVYLREAYDFLGNLSLLQRTPPPSEQMGKYGPGKLLYLHDFNKGHAFIINQDLGNCSYERLTGSEWDAKKDTSSVRLRNPREYFDMEGAQVQFKGSGPVRGVPADMFIGFKELKSPQTAGLAFNTTIEWHFVNKTLHDVISDTMSTVSIPAAIRTYSDASWLNSWLYIFDYDTSDMHFYRHDISACVGSDWRKHFMVNFPLESAETAKYVRDRPKQFMSYVLPLMAAAADFSRLRIYDPEVSSDSVNAVVEFSIIDAPYGSGDISLEEVERRLEQLVTSGKVVALFSDDSNNLLSSTANQIDSLQERYKNLKSIGYTAVSLIGIAMAMALAGLLAGIAVVYGVYRARGSTLSDIDPFKHSRMA